MTKEEILAMDAGKELDAVVDKEIFGGDGCVHDLYWVDPEEYACTKCHKQFCDPEPYSYSTDISAAWLVTWKMSQLGHNMSLLLLCNELYPEPYWYCDFRVRGSNAPPRYEWVDHQKSAPEVICKAALLAKLKIL